MTGKIKKESKLIMDITAGKLTEDTVRRSEQRYSDLFSYSNDAILICMNPRKRPGLISGRS